MIPKNPKHEIRIKFKIRNTNVLNSLDFGSFDIRISNLNNIGVADRAKFIFRILS